MIGEIARGQIVVITGTRYMLACLLVALFCVLPYLNALHGEFVLDDGAFYLNNPTFAAEHNVGHFFLTSWWENSNLQSKDPLYRPLGLTVMWANQKLFGGNVVAHHLFNIGMHIAAALLLLQLLCRLLPESGLLPPLAGALIFAVHPVHVEAVTWIIAYGHVMATVLALGAMLCYLRYLGSAAWRWFCFSLVLFALALLTMETVVVFPLLVTAYEYLRFRRIKVKRVAPFWVALALYFAVRRLVLGQAVPLEVGDLSAWGTMLSFAKAYIEPLVFPWPQFAYVYVPDGGIITPTGGVLALSVVVGAVVMTRLQVPEKKVMVFGLCWIGLALSAPILAALHPQPLFGLRSLYLPSVGVSILTAWIVAVPLRKHLAIALAAIGILVIAAVPTTLAANRDWLNDTVVYEKILRVTPKAPGVAIKIADIYEKRGDVAAAEQTLLHAIGFEKDDEARIDVYESLGFLYGKRGATVKSEQYYRKIVELSPKRASAWVGLGNNAWARGEINPALDFYLMGFGADPKNYEASYNVALAYRQLGDQEHADEYFLIARNLQQETSSH